MASLFGPPTVERHRTLPEEIKRDILVLKAEHPALNSHEIATISDVQFGRCPSHHTVRRILAKDLLLILVGRRFPPYYQIADSATRRHAVLAVEEPRVYETPFRSPRQARQEPPTQASLS